METCSFLIRRQVYQEASKYGNVEEIKIPKPSLASETAAADSRAVAAAFRSDDGWSVGATLCAFPVDAMGKGTGIDTIPFVTPEFGIFLPVQRYGEVVPWMMANRGELDVLVHPNSCGWKCSPQDHLLWSLWGGDKWKVRFQLPSIA